MTVWVLIFYVGSHMGAGPAVIDNIATMQECERIRAEIKANVARCIEVRKTR
jgi:hypothetical protein